MTIRDVLEGTIRWTLVPYECTTVLRCLPDRAVDHVFADPPYSEAVHARSIRRTYLPDTAEQPCRRTRKHDFGFHHLTREACDQYAAEMLRVSDRWVLAFSDMELSSWWIESFADSYVRFCVSVKDRAMPQISGDRPSSRAEAIILGHRAGKKDWNKRPDGSDSNVWQYPVVANCSGHRFDRVHTAQKPLELMLDLVASFTSPGDVILDPFAGSGTTGVAALRLGRRAILIERDPAIAAVAVERMQAEEQNSTLQAARTGQLPLMGS